MTAPNEDQVIMDDALYSQVLDYLKIKNISLRKFCNEINLPTYMVEKIMDRKIKMKIFQDTLDKIEDYIKNNY